jgi:competence protein ComEC
MVSAGSKNCRLPAENRCWGQKNMKILVVSFLMALLSSATPKPETLDVYVIDVEGGKAMLVKAPSGQSMLVDAGWPGFNGRDVDRIIEAAKTAKLKKIDYLVITHLDVDHVGDVPLLLSKFPVGRIVDNGPVQTTGKGVEKRYEMYAAARNTMPHGIVKPGDRIPIKGVDATVVAAGAKVIERPLRGGGISNPVCAGSPQAAEIPSDREDNMSIGLLFTYGRFRMLDLADLEAHFDYMLMCPRNLVGAVDVYHVNVHGQAKGSSPVLEHALAARVAIMNNGARKGGDPESWQSLRSAPGLEDIWQLHYSVKGGKENNPPDDFIANPEPTDCQGRWIKLSARLDGSFVVTNGRNGFSKTYEAHQ